MINRVTKQAMLRYTHWTSLRPSPVFSLGEEDARGEERCNKGTNTLDTLSEIKTDFRVTRRPADGKEIVGAGLERGQASSNDEHAATETSEGCFYSTWPKGGSQR